MPYNKKGAGQHDTDQNPSGPSTSTSQTAEEQVDVKVVVTPDEVRGDMTTM